MGILKMDKREKKRKGKRGQFLGIAGAVLVMSFLTTEAVHAEELPHAEEMLQVEEAVTQKIRLTAVDDWEMTPLSGAEITLAVKEGDTYTDVNGKTNLGIPTEGVEVELGEGEYRLVVDKTPAGYITSAQPVVFRVTAEAVVLMDAENADLTPQEGRYTLTLYNAVDFDYVLPATGGMGTRPFTVAGILLIVAGLTGRMAMHARKKHMLLIITALTVVTAFAGTSLPAMAAGSQGYTYYVMMKTFAGEAPAEYYVEEESLAKALDGLTVNGTDLFTVEQVDGKWYVNTGDEADCSAKEVAEALATIKDSAIESAPLTKRTLELGYGALILVQTRAGTYFVVEVDGSEQNLFGHVQEVEDKNTYPKIIKVSSSDNKYSVSIGEPVNYEININSVNGSSTLHMIVPSGLTLDTNTGNNGTNNPSWTENKKVENGTEYLMSFQGNEGNITITCTATMNKNARAGFPQTIEAYMKYDSDQTEKSHLSFYTYGFDLKVQNGLGNALPGVKYTLQDANNNYYAVPGDTAGITTPVFAEAKSVLTTTDNGSLSFNGLGEGTYTLTETDRPDNYNDGGTITLTIAENGKLTVSNDLTLNYTNPSTEDSQTGAKTTYKGTLTLTKTATVSFPKTGGRGAIIFYVVGGLLVLGGAFLLIDTRRLR